MSGNLCKVAFLYIFSMQFFLNWKMDDGFLRHYSLFKKKSQVIIILHCSNKENSLPFLKVF